MEQRRGLGMVLRSLVFGLVFYGITLVLSVLLAPSMLLPRPMVGAVSRFWVRICLWVVNVTLGIDVKVEGRENMPDGPAIYASKHQSAAETLAFCLIVPDLAYILKRELFWVPIWGWYVWRVGMIGVNRSAGGVALKDMTQKAAKVLDAGRSIVIFPQGTRTPPGTRRKYLPGTAALYAKAGVPVVPVALNSGLFWPRRKLAKYRGTITIQILEPIPPGLDKRAFLRRLEDTIEPATRELENRACEEFGLRLPAPVAEKPVDNSVGETR